MISEPSWQKRIATSVSCFYDPVISLTYLAPATLKSQATNQGKEYDRVAAEAQRLSGSSNKRVD
jgi:hypothetical protein